MGPYQPPTGANGTCPNSPLITGEFGADNSLIGLWQPDPLTGQLCPVLPSNVVVGDVLIVALATPQTPPGGQVNISVEEFHLADQTYTERGANNSTITLHRTVHVGAQWSNASVPAAAREVQQFTLTVPPQFVPLDAPANLTVSLLGVVFELGIATPNTELPVPTTYGQFLEFGFAFEATSLVVFGSGAGIAALIVARARYIPSLIKPAAALGIFCAAFGGWALGDTRQAIFLLGQTSVFAFYVPLFVFSILIWVAIFPPRAELRGTAGPIPELVDGRPGWTTREFRIYRQPDGGLEWCSERRWAVFLRLLGIRNECDPYVLSPAPAEYLDPRFHSPRRDVKLWYHVWDNRENQPGSSIVKHPHRVWLFPWRKSVQERRARWLAELKRDPELARVGVFLAIDRGKLSIAAGGERTSAEAIRWPLATRKEGRMAVLFDRALTTIMDRSLATLALADERARKYATISRVSERLSTHPETVRELEALAADREQDLFGVDWRASLEQSRPKPADPVKPKPDDNPSEDTTPEQPQASASSEALDPNPPWRRGKRGRRPS